MSDVNEEEIRSFLLRFGKDNVYGFIALCAELANIWCTDEDIENSIEDVIGERIDPVRFLRTAWIFSEMAHLYEPLFRRVRKEFPLLYMRLRDQLNRHES